MSVQINHQQASKTSWTSTHPDGTVYPGDDKIQIACLQRIANATEAMAANYLQLQQELEQAKKDRDKHLSWYYQERNDNRDLQRTISALKGVVTRLKNQKKMEVQHG